jgi:hypothetical protein
MVTMRPLMKVAAVPGIIAAALFALSALATPGAPAAKVTWGVLSNAASFALLDGGAQQSMCFTNPAGIDSIACTVYDAGSPAQAYGGATLLASNDCVNFYPAPTGPLYVTDGGPLGNNNLTLLAGPATVAFDPVSSGAMLYAVVVDAGGTLSGSVSCTISSKGLQP